MEKTTKKVIVGLSGGVDSAVCAALLKEQGYAVTGVFLRLWEREDAEKDIRGKNDTEEDVRRICEKLDIPLEIVDARKKFKEKVVKYFLREYQSVRTPNPCVFCNENLKFSFLFSELEKMGADFVATGHYAHLRREITNSKLKTKFLLMEARDRSKDQSYFLYRLKQKQLSRLIFPLGDYEKNQVKKMACKMKLGLEKKKESQDVCFLVNKNVSDFLKNNLTLLGGDILDQNGKNVGRHAGLPLYTIGQRKGINIGGTGPYYVFGKDEKRNILRVTNDPADPALFFSEIMLEKVNWTGENPELPFSALVRVRYQQKKVYGTIKKQKTTSGEKYLVEFESPQKFVAPGQSVVFYSEEGEVLGGGIIG